MQIHHLFSCVAKSCFYSGGRIVVATTSEPPATQGHRPSTPPPSDPARQKGEEVIAAVACWEPPNRRMNPWNILSIIRSGALKVLKGSGVGAVMVRYPRSIHSSIRFTKIVFSVFSTIWVSQKRLTKERSKAQMRVPKTRGI